MKKLIMISMLLLVVIACKKDSKLNNNTAKNENNSNSYFSATIDGEKFDSGKTFYYKQLNVISFAAQNKDNSETIKMYIESKKGQETYNFG